MAKIMPKMSKRGLKIRTKKIKIASLFKLLAGERSLLTEIIIWLGEEKSKDFKGTDSFSADLAKGGREYLYSAILHRGYLLSAADSLRRSWKGFAAQTSD